MNANLAVIGCDWGQCVYCRQLHLRLFLLVFTLLSSEFPSHLDVVLIVYTPLDRSLYPTKLFFLKYMYV